jgi:MFS family permease
MQLVGLAFGTALLFGALIAIFLAGYALTGWRSLLFANLGVAILAIVSFGYLMYRRSRLTMRL